MIQTLFGSVEQEPSLLERLKSGVEKTRAGLVSRLEDALAGKKEIDADLLDELEYTLISADIGVRTTNEILERIRQQVDRKLVGDAAELRGLIRQHLLEILQSTERPVPHVDEPPAVVMVVGVNGAGKTTSIGKLAGRYKAEGRAVLLCAADTFRAAAIEQLEIWGERTATEVIRQQPGSRPERSPVRCPAGSTRTQDRLRDCGHRGTPANQDKPDGRAGEDAAHGRPRDSRRAA